MTTRARTYDDLDDFAADVEPLLAADRARSTVLSTVLRGLLTRPYAEPPAMVATLVDGAPTAVVLQTSPHPITVLALPGHTDDLVAGAELVADVLDRAGRRPQLVTGPVEDATPFAEALAAAAGTGPPRRHTQLIQFRLAGLVEPDPAVPGGPRRPELADPADPDVAVVARWFYEFGLFTRVVPTPTDPRPDDVVARAGRGAATLLWEVDGEPVALAGHSVVVGGMARIGPVFTPAEFRNRRYGSAVTAAAVRSAQAAGARDVLLFTDADYPTSNAVYRRLGFVEVGEFVELALSDD